MANDAKCCQPGCDRLAEYEVREIGAADPHTSYTHSCTEHIPKLLTDAIVHEVVRLVAPGDASPVYR